jgi:hypothetical protein
MSLSTGRRRGALTILPLAASLPLVAFGSCTSGGQAADRVSIPAASEPSAKFVSFHVPGRALSFRYPANWYVTTRRLDQVIDPHTLFTVTSYVNPRRPLEPCDGTRALGRPVGGAFILVKEVLDGASLRIDLRRLPRRPRHFRLPGNGRAGCLPPVSTLFEFRARGRAFYVFLSVGPKASAKTRAAAVALLDGLRIGSRRRP